MRWSVFGIFALVVLVLQVSVARLLGLGPQRVTADFLLLSAVVLTLAARSDEALLAAWVFGLAKDLTSQAPLGSYALGFGLLALALVHLRRLLYRDNPLTLMALLFAGSMFVEQFAIIVSLLKDGVGAGQYASRSLMMILAALLSAAVGPYWQWLIRKLSRRLHLPSRAAYVH